MLLMPVSPSMLDARDAYLAADVMRFGGANQAELWRAFARRGFGTWSFSSNNSQEGPTSDTDPRPNFVSPLHVEARVGFQAVAVDEGNAPIQSARIYVGHYEARVSPIADTNPATDSPDVGPSGENLDHRAWFVPGTYEFIAHAPGYGHVRFTRTLTAGSGVTVSIPMRTNRASAAKGAVATGDGVRLEALIDDTEGTNWERTGAMPNVSGSQVTVDLQGGVRTVGRVQVSALLTPGQSRFTALRRFRIEVSRDGVNFTPIYTSPANAFPGFNPRPVGSEMLLRSFDVPDTRATHVRIVVLTNQCTGNGAFQGDQDADPANGTDCREGSPGSGPVPLPGDPPQVLAPRDNDVRIAELQVFSG
jgi:hypothetical protein